MADLSLDTGVSTHSSGDWERAAAAVLRRTGRLDADDPDSAVWAALARQTLDGIEVMPLGTSELIADLPVVGLPGQSPYVRGSAGARVEQGWDVRPSFADPDASATAAAVLTDLENGATSVWLTLGAGGIALDRLPQVLEPVLLDVAPVVLDCAEDPVAGADTFLGVLAGRDVAAAAGTNLGADPIAAAVRAGEAPADPARIVSEIAERAIRNDVRGFVVDATAVHDLGASDGQELAYSLAVGAAYLRALVAARVELDVAVGLLEFRYAATDEQFPTIAKLRAARKLWHRVAELSGVSVARRGQSQHAVTSRPMMSTYDPYVNMLRTTVAAFAAGVGGADAVTVLPFDERLGLPDAFSRRIARNTSTLLVAEAHVAAVTDPAGGAYAVERLTDDLARAAWSELGRIDATGGVLGGGLDGLRERIDEIAAVRRDDIAHRRRPLTGVTEFPNLPETLPERQSHGDGALRVPAYGADFEELRDDPAAVPVFVATMGPVSAHTARATFAVNLLASGGVGGVLAGASSGVGDVLTAYDGQPVVLLAGPDGLYAEWGEELAGALRSAGARWVVVAGPAMDYADDSAAVGVDALAFVLRIRSHLKDAP